MSDFHKPDEDEDDDDGDEESSEEEEEEEIDLEMIKAKFSSLSSALQETNQNLVTIEMLQDHYRNVSKASATPNTTLPSSGGPDLDIVDLLKDICGSVNELKTEMGNSGREGKINLEEIESKLKYPQKFAELSEKSSKMEVECGFFKTQCQSLEEKYMDEKQKNSHLEDLIRDRENEIRQLNLYLKEAETFSKSVEQEKRLLQMQVKESKSKLEQEIDRKDQLRSDFDINLGKVATLEDRLRSYVDKESKLVETAALNEKAKKDKICVSD